MLNGVTHCDRRNKNSAGVAAPTLIYSPLTQRVQGSYTIFKRCRLPAFTDYHNFYPVSRGYLHNARSWLVPFCGWGLGCPLRAGSRAGLAVRWLLGSARPRGSSWLGGESVRSAPGRGAGSGSAAAGPVVGPLGLRSLWVRQCSRARLPRSACCVVGGPFFVFCPPAAGWRGLWPRWDGFSAPGAAVGGPAAGEPRGGWSAERRTGPARGSPLPPGSGAEVKRVGRVFRPWRGGGGPAAGELRGGLVG